MRDINLFLLKNKIQHEVLIKNNYVYIFSVNNISCELFYFSKEECNDNFSLTFYLPKEKAKPLFLSSIMPKIKLISSNGDYVFNHIFDNFETCKRLILHLRRIN